LTADDASFLDGRAVASRRLLACIGVVSCGVACGSLIVAGGALTMALLFPTRLGAQPALPAASQPAGVAPPAAGQAGPGVASRPSSAPTTPSAQPPPLPPSVAPARVSPPPMPDEDTVPPPLPPEEESTPAATVTAAARPRGKAWFHFGFGPTLCVYVGGSCEGVPAQVKLSPEVGLHLGRRGAEGFGLALAGQFAVRGDYEWLGGGLRFVYDIRLFRDLYLSPALLLGYARLVPDADLGGISTDAGSIQFALEAKWIFRDLVYVFVRPVTIDTMIVVLSVSPSRDNYYSGSTSVDAFVRFDVMFGTGLVF